jgi:7,8-dihydro-6-hydroxymethylpterin-pyrophosphokinase
MQYYEVYLLFGSNLGERAANIANAITQLENQGIKP